MINSAPVADPRVVRHAKTKAKIVRAAWRLAARDGVAAVSLTELAKRVGLRQPSLYTYFASKHALYDELFADGNRQLLAEVAERDYPDDPRSALVESAIRIVLFSAADVSRHELLFQRPVPAFEPSAESYALAQRFYDWHRDLARRAGVTRREDFDAITALIAGLADQQVANDPSGDRWLSLTEPIMRMLLVHIDERGGLRRTQVRATEG
jgi:AcrR family transcriptional regulator